MKIIKCSFVLLGDVRVTFMSLGLCLKEKDIWLNNHDIQQVNGPHREYFEIY